MIEEPGISAVKEARFDHPAIRSAAEALLARRGFTFVFTPEDGQDAYDLSLEALAEARVAVGAYLGNASLRSRSDADLVERLWRLLSRESATAAIRKDEDGRDLLIEGLVTLERALHRERVRMSDPMPIAELGALVEERLRSLEDLYERTGKDWILTVDHVLTEPVCPSVVIAPEGSNALRYAVHRDTLIEGILAAVDLVHREQILGETIVSESPITNPDDRTWPDVVQAS